MSEILFAGSGRTAHITSGQRRRPISEPAHTITGSETAVFIFPDGSSRGITPKEASALQGFPVVVDSREVTGRNMTVEEASTLQGFPRPFVLAGSKSKQFLQIGNAVPPPMVYANLAHLWGPTPERDNVELAA